MVSSEIWRFENDPVSSKHWFNSSETKISRSKSIRNLIRKCIEFHNYQFSSKQISKYLKDSVGTKVLRLDLMIYLNDYL